MAPVNTAVDCAFFDIGGTLGDPVTVAGKLTLKLFPSTVGMLTAVRDSLRLRIGVITTLGTLTNSQGRALLTDAGIAGFLDAQGFISEHDVGGVGKPNPAIYQFAAQQMGVPIERCLFVGENLIEVIGAMTAGMQAVLKPCPPGRDLPI